MQRIPWHLWNFFSRYQFAEAAIGLPQANRVEKLNITREKIRILGIFGDDKGIDIKADKQYLENLPKEAETIYLVKPNRQELHRKLSDEKGWDIICFSGHSESKTDGSTGCFYLDLENNIQITIEESKYVLTAAIKKGLQLAIFNSCDGLGLAKQLACLYIPAIIVMREPVPDLVAQEFLKHFLQLFASGKSLSLSVRQTREKLEYLEYKFPGASWLPVICQNSAEIPPTWQSLYRNFPPDFAEVLEELRSAIKEENWLTSADKTEALQQVKILDGIDITAEGTLNSIALDLKADFDGLEIDFYIYDMNGNDASISESFTGLPNSTQDFERRFLSFNSFKNSNNLDFTNVGAMKLVLNGPESLDADIRLIEITNNESQSIPEPTSILGLLVIGATGAGSILKRKHNR